MKKVITTAKAPQAIGTYSQAIQVGNTIYLSGQIALDPETMTLVSDDIELQIEQAFKNLIAVIEASGGTPANVVKLNIYLTDLIHFPKVNTIMSQYFSEPYPARAVVGISQLPRNALIEMDAVVAL